MKIVVAGTIAIDPDRREAALDAARPHIDGALAQAGCEAYSWTADPAAPGRVAVFECWTREADLAAHFAGPHYAAMLRTLGRHGLRGAEVSKYRVDLCEAVYDSNGQPRADFFSAGE